MEQGAHEAKIVEQAQKLKMPLPPTMQNKPELLAGLEFYWRAFWELSTDRDIGMAEGPIPWTAMNQYAARYDVQGDEFDRFVLLIKAMDSVYIERRSAQHKKAMNKASRNNSGPIKKPQHITPRR
jgi:hypothetical protein